MTLTGAAIAVATIATAVALGAGVRRLFGVAGSGLVEEGFFVVAAGWALLSWWGVVLAEVASFTPVAFLVPPAVLAVALWVGTPRGGRVVWGPPDRDALIALGLTIVVALAFFFPAFDVQLEARDPGTYFHAGEQLARDGALVWRDETVTRIGPTAAAYLFPSMGPQRAQHNARFMGFYLEDLDPARIIPQALPVYPVWVAVAYWVAGSSGALAIGGILMAFAAGGLSLLGAAFCGRLGLLAGPLIASGVISGWFARYSAAESAAQLLVVLGGLALIRYRQERGRFHALVAGVAFGLLPLTKAEMLVVLLPLGLLALFDVVTRRLEQRDVLFWGPIIAFGGHSLGHAVGWLWPYYFDILRQYRLTPVTFLMLAAGAAVGGAAALALARRMSRDRAPAIRGFLAGATPGGRAIRWALAGAVLALTAAGYWLRPALWLRGGELVDSWNMANHFELGLGISPLLVFLAALGTAVLLVRRSTVGGVQAAAFILVVISALIFWERNIIPRPMWAFRRWLPVVLPASYVLGLVAVDWLARAGTRLRIPAAATALVVLAPVIAHHATAATWIKSHTELPGSEAAVQQLAQLFGPRDVVLFEPRTNRGLIRFEAALGIQGSPAVYRLPSVDVDPAVVRTLGWERSRVGGQVYLVTTGMLNGLAGLAAEPVDVFEWNSTVLEEFYTYLLHRSTGEIVLPRQVLPLVVNARVYRLLANTRGTELPVRVVAGEVRGEADIGLWDDPYINGPTLYESEIAGRHNFRWTKSVAEFVLPGTPPDIEAVVLRVTENEFQPPQVVEAWLDGIALGSAPVPARWGDVRFAVPATWEPAADGVARLRIQVPTIVPSAVDAAHRDDRDLGIRVDRVFWTRAQSQSER
jgi:hypothetical protein